MGILFNIIEFIIFFPVFLHQESELLVIILKSNDN